MSNRTRATIYFSADLHSAFRMKAAATRRSISDLANEAAKDALAHDAIDLDALAIKSQPDRQRVLWTIAGLTAKPRPGRPRSCLNGTTTCVFA
jgi:hypothetical protein